MSYVKTVWENGKTPVNADNMNKIENELEALSKENETQDQKLDKVNEDIEAAVTEAKEELAEADAKNREDIENEIAEVNKSIADLYKNKANAIIDTVSGSGTVVIPCTIEDGMEIVRIAGASVQETTTGAQLVDLPDIEGVSESGVTWSCKNGVVTAKGTATNTSNSSSVGLSCVVPIIAGTYVVSGRKDITKVYCEVKNSSGETAYYASGQSFALDGTEQRCMLFCQVISGVTVDETIYPMLNYGTEALPWEPYNNGATPRPDYPQPIVSAGQKVASGKNLLQNNGVSDTKNGVSFTVNNDDGTVTVNGTATANTTFLINSADLGLALSVGEKYILSGCPSDGSGSTYRMQFYNTDGSASFAYEYGTGKEFTFSNTGTSYNVVIAISSGVTVSNLVFKPMIRLASISDSEYEPYTGGVPSVYDVGIEVEAHSKNLLNVTASTQTVNGINITANPDGTYTANGTASADVHLNVGTFEIEDGESYVMSGCPSDAPSGCRMYIIYPTGNYNYDTGSGVRIDATSGNRRSGTNIYILSGTKVSNVVFRPMIRMATVTDDTYEPYQSQTAHIDRVLHGIGDVKDELSNDGIVRRFGVVVLDGSDDEAFNYDSSATRLVYTLIADAIKKPANSGLTIRMLCNAFKNITINAIYLGMEGIALSTGGNISMRNNALTSLDAWKSYLAENPITVIYELAEPTTEPLTTDEQLVLHGFKSYDGVTQIEVDSGDVSATITAKSVLDTKMYIDSKFAELAAALSK